MRTIPPPAPRTGPGRILSDGPDGLRYRVAGWRNRRHLLWNLPLLVLWGVGVRTVLAATGPDSPGLPVDLVVVAGWTLPSLLLTLQVRACRQVRQITVRPGWIEIEQRAGTVVELERFEVHSLQMLDAATVRVRIDPGQREVELLPRSRAGHWLAARVRTLCEPQERANDEAASLETASFARSDLPVGV